MAPDPHPTAAAPRPVAGHPDVLGTRSHRDYFHLRWWRCLGHNHGVVRRAGLGGCGLARGLGLVSRDIYDPALYTPRCEGGEAGCGECQ